MPLEENRNLTIEAWSNSYSGDSVASGNSHTSNGSNETAQLTRAQFPVPASMFQQVAKNQSPNPLNGANNLFNDVQSKISNLVIKLNLKEHEAN